METAIVSIICIALVVFGGMTMSQGFMTSVDASTTGLEEIGQRDETIMKTELSSISTSVSSLSGDWDWEDNLEVTLENSGQTKMADFAKWDVIVQYYDVYGTYHVEWLPYTEATLGDNEWQVLWIRIDGDPEVFEPNVLNPEEQIRIRVKLNPAIGDPTTNMVVVATPNGIPASAHFYNPY